MIVGELVFCIAIGIFTVFIVSIISILLVIAELVLRMIWIITIFCYLMLVLKVGFNYWIYSIGLTILVINIFLLVMSRAEDNDDNDTENKAR